MKEGVIATKKFLELEAIMPEYYSRNPLVKWLFNRRLQIALQYLIKINPHVFIDIGCGDGHFIKLVKQENLEIREMWGIDTNPGVERLKNEIQNCNFKVQSILKTEFPDETFDTAVCLDVLEHIEEIEKAISEIRRILIQNGHMIISEPTETSLYRSLRFLLKGTYSHESGPCAGKHYYNAGQIDRIIQDMGFIRVLSRKTPFYIPFDLFHVNLYRKI